MFISQESCDLTLKEILERDLDKKDDLTYESLHPEDHNDGLTYEYSDSEDGDDEPIYGNDAIAWDRKVKSVSPTTNAKNGTKQQPRKLRSLKSLLIGTELKVECDNLRYPIYHDDRVLDT